jgi:hypothetical protein
MIPQIMSAVVFMAGECAFALARSSHNSPLFRIKRGFSGQTVLEKPVFDYLLLSIMPNAGAY